MSPIEAFQMALVPNKLRALSFCKTYDIMRLSFYFLMRLPKPMLWISMMVARNCTGHESQNYPGRARSQPLHLAACLMDPFRQFGSAAFVFALLGAGCRVTFPSQRSLLECTLLDMWGNVTVSYSSLSA